MADFLTDVETLRQRARANIEQGPITSAYGADRERVIAVLNEALATEMGRKSLIAGAVTGAAAIGAVAQPATAEVKSVTAIGRNAQGMRRCETRPRSAPKDATSATVAANDI